MKTNSSLAQSFCVLVMALCISPLSHAQILKKAQKKTEQTVERKLEQKTEKETSEAMDSLLNPSQKSAHDVASNETHNDTYQKPQNPSSKSPIDSERHMPNVNISYDLEIYSTFDFVPGEKVLFFDDFYQEFIGDFPSKWDTNASGEVVKINNVEGHWFEMKAGYGIFYIPEFKNLPEDYTIEFDILTQGISNKTSSIARLALFLSDTDEFHAGSHHYLEASLPLAQYGVFDIKVRNFFNRKSGGINNSITTDLRNAVLNQPHIAISVTKNRFRLWVNEKKYVDIPKLINELNVLNYIKFHVDALKDENERIFISNLKIAEGGIDLRLTLMSEGKVSTNGILFDSGSSNIKPQSLGIIYQIAQVLIQDPNMKLNIVDHTDANGSEDANLKLSKDRSESVKNALVNIYKVSAERLQTDGKGGSIPVGDNTSIVGKAQNSRIEFIKI